MSLIGYVVNPTRVGNEGCKKVDAQNYKSSLADIVAGDWVVLTVLGNYSEGSSLVKVVRTTATQIIVPFGDGEKRFNRKGEKVGGSGWRTYYIKAPLYEYYGGRTALAIARADMEKLRLLNLRNAIKAKVNGDVPTATLEAVARLLGIEV